MFSSKVLSLFVGIMIYFVDSMSSEPVVTFIAEENEVEVADIELPGLRVEVSDMILSVCSVVIEGV